MIQKRHLFHYFKKFLYHPGSIPDSTLTLFKLIYAVLYHPLTAVTIEISSRCNRKCPFCPNSMYKREIAYMEDELFYKIVDELREIHFAGRVSFALYSEPLLDKRLPKFVEYASKQLPAAYFNLSTNGDFLDISMWKSLMAAGMDFIFVSQYDGRLNDNIVKLSNILKEDEKMHIEVRIFDVMRDAYCNRGGLVKAGKDIDLPLQKFCIWPFFYMPINYKGKAGICCNDYFGLVEIGDANHQHIADIWHSKILNTYRKKLLLGDRTGLTLCKECNVSPLWEYLPAPAQKIIQPMKKKRTKRFN